MMLAEAEQGLKGRGQFSLVLSLTRSAPPKPLRGTQQRVAGTKRGSDGFTPVRASQWLAQAFLRPLR